MKTKRGRETYTVNNMGMPYYSYVWIRGACFESPALNKKGLGVRGVGVGAVESLGCMKGDFSCFPFNE